MTRPLVVAAAQLGPVAYDEPRASVVDRMTALLRQAAAHGVELAVFPEAALTTFFPRWAIEDEAELDRFFEEEMPGPETQALFDEATRLGVGFYLGYCELVRENHGKRRFNTSVLVDGGGHIVGKYRKVHLPGTAEPVAGLPFQHLEQAYFEPGDLGFGVWPAFGGLIGMCLCNDRRWSETYRVMGLQGVELILLGYNSPAQLPDHPEMNHLRTFHHLVGMQAGAYENGTWIVASAKAGPEGGVEMMGQSCVIAPSGEVVALSTTRGDELVACRIDLDATAPYKAFFDFAANRRPECYRPITDQAGATPPEGACK